jgi:lysophospholipase L1-like esterase
VRRAAALGLAFGVLLPASASAEHRLSLSVGAAEPGYIDLRIHARPNVPVTITEDAGGSQAITPSAADTELERFAVWRCDRRTRRFSVTQAATDGALVMTSGEVRTPSCARRLALRAPRAVRAGVRPAIEIQDRWRIGGTAAALCVRAPGAGRHCSRVRLRRGSVSRRVRIGALRPGGYRITARTPYQRLRRTLRANPPSGRLRVLATGDSMIQIIDSYLRQRVASRHARVRSDARISTGLSKPSLLDWRAHARRQARKLRPDVTVMFIGANDGFPMAGADCCGRAWVAEYARRARRMMHSYARGGRGRVYWLTLPAPRGGFFREIFPAVNAALRRAARDLEDDVRLIDLAGVFTPGGRYRDSMEIGGKIVRVRQSDGVHLNATGAALAATLVIRALHRDRMLR